MTILLTVSPSEAVQILNGTLATLIRSWKVPLGTAYICCSKPKKKYRIGSMGFFSDELYRTPKDEIKFGSSVELMAYDNYDKSNFLSGKVPCKFVVEKEENLEWDDAPDYFGEVDGSPLFDIQDVCKQAGISDDDLIESSGDCCETLSFLHITSLEIFEKPLQLSEFKHMDELRPLTKAPSSYCYVIPPRAEKGK